ncbi:SURF1 family cytochrome oxidase biogenesis protein [Leucobacter sp.]
MSATPHEPSRRPEYLGEPTLGQVMRRPRWILALLLALLVAAVFAWLGQWQMDNAIRSDAQQTIDTETPRALGEVAEAGSGVTDAAAGMVVRVRGALVPGDTRIVTPRENAGETGTWVVGHLAVEAEAGDEGAGLAVAIGWAPGVAEAEAAAARFEADPAFSEPRDLEGRFMPPEGPVIPKGGEDPQVMHAMVPAQLVNTWQSVAGPVHSGYLVLHPAGDGAGMLDAAGLDAIDSVPPEPAESVNWLNVFYAIEWIVFAGFAIFLWYRLARDAWEKEHELQLLTAAESE